MIRYTILLLFFLFPFVAPGQMRLITLDKVTPDYVPKYFRVVAVKDMRKDTGAIGTLEWPAGKSNSYQYANGLTSSLMQSISRAQAKDTSQPPIELRIVKLDFAEKKPVKHVRHR